MTNAYEDWLKALYTEVSIFAASGLISLTLRDQFTDANHEFLKKNYNIFRSLRDLGTNKNLPILEVLNLIPEKDSPYSRDQFFAKLQEKPNVALIEIPKMPETSSSSSAANDGIAEFSGKEGGYLKLTELLPDTFQGFPSESASNHFEKYKDYCLFHSLNEEQSIARFPLSLSNLPRKWIKNKRFTTMAELEKAFLCQYSKYKSREAVIRALSQFKYVPGTGLDRYLAEITELAQRAGHTQEQICDVFVNGLPDSLRANLLLHPYKTVDELIDKAQKYLELNPAAAAPQVSFAVQDTISLESLAKSIDEIKGELKSLKERNSRSFVRQNRGRPVFRGNFMNNNRGSCRAPLPLNREYYRRPSGEYRNRSYNGASSNSNARGFYRSRRGLRSYYQSPVRSPPRSPNFPRSNNAPRRHPNARRQQNF